MGDGGRKSGAYVGRGKGRKQQNNLRNSRCGRRNNKQRVKKV